MGMLAKTELNTLGIATARHREQTPAQRGSGTQQRNVSERGSHRIARPLAWSTVTMKLSDATCRSPNHIGIVDMPPPYLEGFAANSRPDFGHIRAIL